MRTSIFAIVVVTASAVGFPAMAQQNTGPQKQAAPSEQTKAQMHQNVDKQQKTTGQATDQTSSSGTSGYVKKPGASPNAGK